ncbi:twin-arginine translocase subunit TatC [Rhizomonospora bruguierae]|uniref:twin-arginine translocase subunit TatC n=1 Tax=Rhizomonospora bruguierae TaxID=1581705 RepID=UPI0020BDA0FE|nr:twin-arginine translocase subunit TatC [Micromonospora sp. NBRC 107566]
MNLLPRRRAAGSFERAADGSMTLVEHLRELRSRLFKASLAVVAGLVVGVFFARHIQDFLNSPYCDFQREHWTGPGAFRCDFNARSPVDTFLLQLRIGLYAGLLIGSPIWLYQLWAFIAPGLHRRERRYTYAFTAVAVPLFAAGAFLAWFVVSKSLVFFLGMNDFQISIDVTGYFDFVTGVMLLFGIAFEFPLAVVMLNFAGVVTARRLLGWWRPVIFLTFLFAAIVTPTPDPFGMTALAAAMGLLYFGAVFVAYLNDRRRARKNAIYAGLDDDEVSPLEMEYERVGAAEPIGTAEPVEPPSPVDPPAPIQRPRPLDDRYDETT